VGTSCSSSAGAVSAKRHIDIRNVLRRDTTLAIFCAPQVRFRHKADMPRCLLFVRFSNRPSGSSTFRLTTTPVSMSLTGSRFSSDSAPRPLYEAIIVKLIFDLFHLLVRPAGDYLVVPT